MGTYDKRLSPTCPSILLAGHGLELPLVALGQARPSLRRRPIPSRNPSVAPRVPCRLRG